MQRGIAVVTIALAVPAIIRSEAMHVPADGQDVRAALDFTAAHAQPDYLVLVDSLSGTNIDAGVLTLRGERVDGPRLWTTPKSVLASVARHARNAARVDPRRRMR